MVCVKRLQELLAEATSGSAEKWFKDCLLELVYHGSSHEELTNWVETIDPKSELLRDISLAATSYIQKRPRELPPPKRFPYISPDKARPPKPPFLDRRVDVGFLRVFGKAFEKMSAEFDVMATVAVGEFEFLFLSIIYIYV